jgi:Fe-S cluster biogenesis protein NfuA
VLVKLNATNQGLSKLEGTMAQTLELTAENVEKVLNELRPYLQADGGNVELVEIDGPVVKLRLQGACGACPSSTLTLKMGIERKLRERIPDILEVEQVF